MKQRMFTIFDVKAQAYLPPWFLPETAMALRTFADCCNSSTHQFGAHPEDYYLYEIATFDNTTAEIDVYKAPKIIAKGPETVRSQKDLEDYIPSEEQEQTRQIQ